jgi:hypothetical protein
MARIALGRGPILPICLIFAAALSLLGARPVTQGAATAGAGLPESPGTHVRESERSLSGELFFHMEIFPHPGARIRPQGRRLPPSPA